MITMIMVMMVWMFCSCSLKIATLSSLQGESDEYDDDDKHIWNFRFFYNAYFQDKKVDRNGTSKVDEQVVQVNKLKGEEEKKASNEVLPKVEKKEKVQWSPNMESKVWTDTEKETKKPSQTF